MEYVEGQTLAAVIEMRGHGQGEGEEKPKAESRKRRTGPTEKPQPPA